MYLVQHCMHRSIETVYIAPGPVHFRINIKKNMTLYLYILLLILHVPSTCV